MQLATKMLKLVICIIFVIYCFLSLPIISAEIQIGRFQCDNGTEISAYDYLDQGHECKSDLASTMSLPCTNCRCKISSCHGVIDLRMVCMDHICNDSLLQCEIFNETTYCKMGCSSHYWCQNGACVKRSTLCDSENTNGCKEEDDGWASGIGFKCFRAGRKCRIPQQLLWDEIADCDEGVDLCYSTSTPEKFQTSRDVRLLPNTYFNQSNCFKCFDGSMIIPRFKVCDDEIDCSDLSDECMCEGKESKICERTMTCRIFHQEKSNVSLNLNTKKCELGQMRCSDTYCVNQTSVCDTNIDCVDGLDENYDDCKGTMNCFDVRVPKERAGEKCRCRKDNENVMGTLCDGDSQCPEPEYRFSLHSQEECHPWCPHKSLSICKNDDFVFGPHSHSLKTCLDKTGKNKTVYLWDYCNGKADCLHLEDEENCPSKFRCPSGKLVSIESYKKCDGIVDCDDGSDESQLTCPHRFFCSLNNGTISLDRSSVCDYVINCKDQSDERNCTDTRFYCENKTPLFVRQEKVFDGFVDCSDGSDECPVAITDVLSSKYQLIANPILRAFVWVAALVALVGNLVVIAKESRIINNMSKSSSTCSLKTYHVLLLNLGIAHLLMGIYLLMLGIAGAVFDGKYCLKKVMWRDHVVCHVMGVLVVIASESSVFIVVILTSFRIFAVYKPFAAATRPKLPTTLFLVLTAWAVSIMLGLVPIASNLEYIFTDKVLLKDKMFFTELVVSLQSAKVWVEKTLTFDPRMKSACNVETLLRISNAKSWQDLSKILENSTAAEYFKPVAFFGYYGTNSPCIPELFVTKKDPFWQYSFTLVLINFFSFVYVACAYAFIIFEVRKDSNDKFDPDPRRSKELKGMQSKIYRIIAINFCCWVPITIMVFVNFSGISLGDVAYSVASIVLLPINSAFDPIIYSNVIDIISVKIASFRRSVKKEMVLKTHSSVTAVTKL